MLQIEIFQQRSNPLSQSVTVTDQNYLQLLQIETFGQPAPVHLNL